MAFVHPGDHRLQYRHRGWWSRIGVPSWRARYCVGGSSLVKKSLMGAFPAVVIWFLAKLRWYVYILTCFSAFAPWFDSTTNSALLVHTVAAQDNGTVRFQARRAKVADEAEEKSTSRRVGPRLPMRQRRSPTRRIWLRKNTGLWRGPRRNGGSTGKVAKRRQRVRPMRALTSMGWRRRIYERERWGGYW